MSGEVDSLGGFVEKLCGDVHTRVESDLGGGYVRLHSTEASKRQAKHDIRYTEDIVIEMLRNARDAGARNIFFATGVAGGCRKITMIDDGSGIPENMHEGIFEARVTSKLDSVHFDSWGIHGRGMALYSIAIQSRRAYVATSQVGMGSAFVVETALRELPEKTDQSTWPIFVLGEDKSMSARGPRNINRIVCEFAVAHHNELSIYLGTPVDVAATLYHYGAGKLDIAKRTFANADELAVCLRLACASDCADFAKICAGVGLEVSERSARRIMDGEITPLKQVKDTLQVRSVSEDAESAPGVSGAGGASGGAGGACAAGGAGSAAGGTGSADGSGSPGNPSESGNPTESGGAGGSSNAASTGKAGGAGNAGAASAKNSKIKLAQEDLQEFAAATQQAYAQLAEKYYLEQSEAQVKVTSDKIVISFPYR